MNPKVDAYLRRITKWRKEIEKLRAILLDFGFTEELKWRIPCYTLNGRNLIAINALKNFCALSIFQGALLKDPQHILKKPGEHTQAGRWIKFTSLHEIDEKEFVLKAYILAAIEAEKAGLKFTPSKNPVPKIPVELRKQFQVTPDFKTAFFALTPGRQRGYVLYFSAAKQSRTRASRIEKNMPRIFKRKGLHD